MKPGAPTRQTDGALLAVAAHGLASTRRPPAAPLDDDAWATLLLDIQRERMAGLLDHAIARQEFPATSEQAAQAERAAAQGARGVVRVERILLEVAAVLEQACVRFAVLKGPAVAHLDERDPVLRHYADLDLLVPGEHLPAAVAALGTLGFARDLPERVPGFDERFAKEISLAGPAGHEIDVHRTIALGAFGFLVDLAELWARTDQFPLGGSSLPALDAEGRFVNACFNAVLGDERPRLVALRDVAVLATSHAFDGARLARLAPPGRGGGVVRAALGLCEDTLGVDLAGVAPGIRSRAPGRRERIALRCYRSQGGTNTLELLSGAVALPGPDAARYLRALLRPAPAYRAARAREGRPNEWRAGAVELLGGLRPVRLRLGRGSNER